MARFGLDRAEQFGGQGGGGFFKLSYGVTAHIRFLYNSISEVEGYSVHAVQLNGKKRYVDCLRGANDDKDKCPFCKTGMYAEVKYFVPIYDEDKNCVFTWERGKAFGKKIESLFSDYAANEALCATCFNVTKEKDTNGLTHITIEPGCSDGAEVDDYLEVPLKVYGNLVLVKTAGEMEYYMEYGDFRDKNAC